MLPESEPVIIILKIVYITALVYQLYELLDKSKRRWWVRPVNLTREQEGFFNTCLMQMQSMDDDHFYKATRMSVEKFQLLYELLKNKLQKLSQRKPIRPETRLAVTILYLAHGCCFEFLAWSHKIGISTVREIIYETCQAIWDEWHGIYLAPMNKSDWKHVSEEFFTKTGMPNCLGAIDGKHVNIVKPAQSGSQYYNYKKIYSIVLLASCDVNNIFTYVDVGALGSQSDGGVFARSTFGKKILNNTLSTPKVNFLPGTETKARVHIEISFGILANRWRVLQTTISTSPKNVDKIVLATVVLHNFLMLQKDSTYYNCNDVELCQRENQLPSASRFFSNRSSNEAFQLRDTLKNYLISEQ